MMSKEMASTYFILRFAILAAIAVPNFLEAQTRAKISRVKADFRSLATALESYVTDVGKYPPGYATGLAIGSEQLNLSLKHLTTPVAYMTSVSMQDPFGEAQKLRILSKTRPIYMYLNYEPIDTAQNLDWAAIIKNERPQLPLHRAWILWSPGPDYNDDTLYWGDFEPQNDAFLGLVYDPTNGTVSKGDLGRLGGAIMNKNLASALNR